MGTLSGGVAPQPFTYGRHFFIAFCLFRIKIDLSLNFKNETSP
jgi:hypothetical protein